MSLINDRIATYYRALESLASGKPHREKALSDKELDHFGSVLKSLQRGLTGERRLAGASYFSREDYLGAYLLYYWPVSYSQVSLALEEIRMRGALPRIDRMLDLGAGPGPASFAAADFGASSARLMDSNAGALESALRLKAAHPETRADFSAVHRDFEKDANIDGGPYDLIVACHSANELWKEKEDAIERRFSLFSHACAALAEGGVLLVVEPSATITGRPALALRDRILAGDEAGEFDCVAPCPGSYPCPVAGAGEGRSCHSTWPWAPPPSIASLAKLAGLDRDSAKATWFAIKKARRGVMLPLSAPGHIEGRIISEPMLNKAGRLRYIVCTAKGLVTLSAKARDPIAGAMGFFALGRGDGIEVEAAETRSDGASFGIVAGTKLKTTLTAPSA